MKKGRLGFIPFFLAMASCSSTSQQSKPASTFSEDLGTYFFETKPDKKNSNLGCIYQIPISDLFGSLANPVQIRSLCEENTPVDWGKIAELTDTHTFTVLASMDTYFPAEYFVGILYGEEAQGDQQFERSDFLKENSGLLCAMANAGRTAPKCDYLDSFRLFAALKETCFYHRPEEKKLKICNLINQKS